MFIEYGVSDDVWGEEFLYGLSNDRIINELLKLEKIGLCVREQYEDFAGQLRDEIFITAKGGITMKHITDLSEVCDDLEKIKTYEMYCGEYYSYQDYINHNPLKKMI